MPGASQLIERLGGGNDSAPAAIRDRPIFGTDGKGAGGDELEAMRLPEDARLKPAAFLIAPRTRRAGMADGPARRGFMRRPEAGGAERARSDFIADDLLDRESPGEVGEALRP
jgi:hypothetical protein